MTLWNRKVKENEKKRLVIERNNRNSIGTVGSRLSGSVDWMKEKIKCWQGECPVGFEICCCDCPAYIGCPSACDMEAECRGEKI